MTKEREALKLALHDIERYQTKRQDFDRFENTLIKIKEALAQPEQPEQEPVATVQCIHGVTIGYLEVMQPVGTKLYTSPPEQREWVGLNANNMDYITSTAINNFHSMLLTEAKLKELNHDNAKVNK